jgi:hypothetical protein
MPCAGVGGHVHHIGAVLKPVRIREATTTTTTTATATTTATLPLQHPLPPVRGTLRRRLMELVARWDLWNCGMLSYEQLHGGFRQPDIGSLLIAVEYLFENNQVQVAIATLKAIAAYLNNLIKKMQNKDLRRVKILNAYFQKNILSSVGGVSLFLFGPGAFRCAYDVASEQCVMQCYEPLLESEGGKVEACDWSKWLQMYCNFLGALPSLFIELTA